MIGKILSFPFRVIGGLIKMIFGLLASIILPTAAIGGIGYAAYKYLSNNPAAAAKAKEVALGQAKKLFN